MEQPYYPGMDIDERERLAWTGDMGLKASAIRLQAARLASGLQQQAIASACGIRISAYSNMENARSFPSRPVMKFFYRLHRVDFNFLVHGDFAQLPADLAQRIFAALATANSEWDRKERSGQHPTQPQHGQ